MDRTKRIIVTLIIVVAAIFGTFVINGFTLLLFEGKTLNNGYLFFLVDSFLYSAWFLGLAVVGAMFLRPRPLMPLGVAAFIVFCSLALSVSTWVSPELTFTQRVGAYFQTYIASFMVFPAFILVGFVVQREAPNLAFKRDALKRAP